MKDESSDDDWSPDESEKTIFDRKVVNFTGRIRFLKH